MSKAVIDTNVILRYLVRDDPKKAESVERLLNEAKERGITLFVPGIVIFEVVWVLEKTYKMEKGKIARTIEAILNTPIFKCESEMILRKALETYAAKNIKFADAVIGHWGLSQGIPTVYTYDEKDFKRIKGVEAKKP